MGKAALRRVTCIATLVTIGCQDAPRNGAPSVATDSTVVAQRSVVVSSTAELLPALASATAGTTVLLQPGEYEISRTLVVPDGVTLLGSGAMKLDAHNRLPIGFAAGTRTVLRSTAGFQGDVLLLGNRSVVRGLTIEDVIGRSRGNVVVARTRGDGEVLSATLDDCEVINPNHPSGTKEGPSGMAVVAITPAPSARDGGSVGSSVELRMSYCIVRSPLGSGIFATNFAPRSRINIVLTENVIVGGLTASAGAGRTFAVSGASATLESRGNVFRADSATPHDVPGWLLSAVATPHEVTSPQAASRNTLELRSTGDRIEGFQSAIVASGALRLIPQAGTLSGNTATLELRQTEIRSLGADMLFSGARSESAGALTDVGNVLRVNAVGVIGSGARQNSFRMTDGPPGTTWQPGNRLEMSGSAVVFAQLNPRIIPAPLAPLFHVVR